jgi:hypothetical protein
MGRTTDSRDLESLKGMAEESVNTLTKLQPGEWLVNGVEVIKPTKIFVRERFSTS